MRLSITEAHLDVKDAPHIDPREANAERVPSDLSQRSKPAAAVHAQTHRNPASPG